jgi:hypothetical protein
MELKRAILHSFDSGSYTATVEIVGSLGSWLSGIAVARNIDSAELIAGRKVGVLFFDGANPNDAVLLAVWT